MALKTVANLTTIQQAQSLKLLLGSTGIDAFIPDEISAGLMPHIFLGQAGGVRLQVAEEDEEEARQIIEHGFDEIGEVPDD